MNQETPDPFFVWFNSTRMHFYTHIKDEVKGISGQDFYNDAMVEHDGHVGQLLKLLDDLHIANDTIVIYTTDNGPHNNQWPDGGLTPFRGEKNTNWEGAYRVPALVRWPGHIPPGTVSHEIFSHLDWVPTLMAAATGDYSNFDRRADFKDLLKQDCPADESTNLCETYLDGYNQLPYLIGKEPAQRKEFIYFNDDAQLVGVRLDDWKVVFAEQLSHGFDVWRDPFVKLRLGKIFNLRRDPYERADTDSNNYNEWWSRRAYFLLPANTFVKKFLGTFEQYPPSQRPFKVDLDKMVDDIIDKLPE
ncbi:sulfatase-like hydrolase/transferase [Microseira wollei]|uniref:sulfatase-like hydrolase/transferase n=1 Tax=Microseira wollei TaxID=467598 RepID=UPI001CFD8D80|nr:sulfatase-like hydrolase/transferase [Microseira wollei]